MKRLILLLLLVAAACGKSEPPAPTPVSKTRPAAPPPPAAVDTDLLDSRDAIAAIEKATTPEEANEARELYRGTERADTVDRILETKLKDLDFAEMSAALNAIRVSKTPEETVKGAELYTGEIHKAGVERAMNEHIDALIEADPTLRRPAAKKPEVRKPERPANPALGIFKDCKTESEAAAVLENYQGGASEPELQLALERWRWSAPEVVNEYTVQTTRNSYSEAIRLEDGRLVVQDDDRRRIFVMNADGTESHQIKTTSTRSNIRLFGVSPDGKYLYTGTQEEKPYQKREFETGLPVLEFGIPQSREFGGEPTGWLYPDGSHLITIMVTGDTYIWNTETGEQVHEVGQFGLIRDVQFTQDGSALWMCSEQRVQSIDLATGKLVTNYRHTVGTPAGFSNDGRLLATTEFERGSAGSNGQYYLVLLNSSDGSENRRIAIAERPYSVHWLASNRHLLVFAQTGIVLLDTEAQEVVSHHKIASHLERSFLDADFRVLTYPRLSVEDARHNVTAPNYLSLGRRP